MVPEVGFAVREAVVAVAVLVGGPALAAHLASQRLGRGADRRGAWRGAIGAMAVLLVAEATGLTGVVGGGLAGLVRSNGAGVAVDGTAVAGGGPLSGGEAGRPVQAVRPAKSPVEGRHLDAVDTGPGRWAVLVWGLGTAVALGRVAVAHLLLGRLRLRLRPGAEETERRTRRLAAELGIGRGVLVGEIRGLACPIVFGIGRPVVALPEGFDRLIDGPGQDAVLAHELGHVRSGDARWGLLADLVAAAAWWHPMAWWARRRLRSESESAADEASLVLGADGPVRLAEALLRFGHRARSTMANHAAFASGGAGRASSLSRRVEALLALEPAAPARDGREWRRRGALALVVVTGTAPGIGARPAVWEEDREMARLSTIWGSSLVGSMALAFTPALTYWQDNGPAPAGAAPPRQVRAAERTEEGAAEAIGLSDEQREEFDRLIEERTEKTKVFMARRPHEPAEGIEINTWWKGSLRQMMTPEQYQGYLNYWSASALAAPARGGVFSPSAIGGAPARGGVGGSAVAAPMAGRARAAGAPAGGPPDFESMEKKILGQLGLSALQAEEAEKFQQRWKKVLAEFQELSREGTAAEVTRRGSEMNKEYNEAMRRILTEEQLEKYRKLWEEGLGGGGAGGAVAPRAFRGRAAAGG